MLWVLQVLLAVAFAAGGLQKLAGSNQMVVLFAKIGVGQWLRYLIGTVELAAAVGVVVPVLSGAAALGLCGLMVGAAGTNLAIGDNPLVPVGFLLASALVAWGRWPQTATLPRRLHR